MAQLHPFHKLCLIPADEVCQQVLLATAGDTIQVLDIKTGRLLSRWPSGGGDEGGEISSGSDEERPSKRRKVENGEASTLSRQGSEASEASIEILADGKLRQKGERRKPKVPDTRLPNISYVISTKDGKHVVAVTAEDKAVRVFRVTRSRWLKQLSSRSLPKRLCAIILNKDDSQILAADKFGDVYSLPLHPSSDYTPKEPPQPEKAFKPAASKLTVHTKGNLEALRQQERQRHIQARKEGLDFEHKLLLGHVSLLTDLAIAEGPVDGQARPFILTADRDEHIRVSRGIPQTHVIENWCLGHKEFVSKLCILPWDSTLLVAGNGEPSLRVYDWQQGKELNVVQLSEILKSDLEGALPTSERSLANLAVSGIWPVNVDNETHLLLVGLEGIPMLFTFQLQGANFIHRDTCFLDGNLLDLVVLPDQKSLILSVDDVHEPGSLKTYRTAELEFETAQLVKLYLIISLSGLELEWKRRNYTFELEKICKDVAPTNRENTGDNSKKGKLDVAPEITGENSKQGKVYEKTYSPVGEFIYGLENLRKKRGHAAEEEEEEEASAVVTEQNL